MPRRTLRCIPKDWAVSCSGVGSAFVTPPARGEFMNGNHANFGLAAGGTLLSLLLAVAGSWAQSGASKSPAASAGPKLAEEEYKNIQALKGIPAEQVIPSM